MAKASKNAVQHPVLPRLSVDFPLQNDKITSAGYTIRVSAPPGIKTVEVTIDQGDWQTCRQSAGYWWFDWSGYENGEHEVTARLVTPEGRSVSSESREFFVHLAARAG
jgi:hypothetical protein